MCKIPGIQIRNSVKSNRKADVFRLNKFAKFFIDDDEFIFNYGARNYPWDMLCVPHNCDMTKNRHHDGTRRKIAYKKGRSLKN